MATAFPWRDVTHLAARVDAMTMLATTFPVMDRNLDDAVSAFASVRPRLLAIAYRILDDASEAEDIVQDTWLRWQRTDRTAVINPTAFLVTTTTRLALNVAQSARRRYEVRSREQHYERSDTTTSPGSEAERAESAEEVVLLLMQKLKSAELAAFLLRKAFDYPYPAISRILDVPAANARQLVSRAGTRLAVTGQSRPVGPAAYRRLTRAFRTASHTGNMVALEDMLAEGSPSRGHCRIRAHAQDSVRRQRAGCAASEGDLSSSSGSRSRRCRP